MIKRIAIAAFVAVALATTTAHATTKQERWEHYRSRVSGNVIIIKTECEAEDTLAHLRLLQKDAGKIVLGCHHRGY